MTLAAILSKSVVFEKSRLTWGIRFLAIITTTLGLTTVRILQPLVRKVLLSHNTALHGGPQWRGVSAPLICRNSIIQSLTKVKYLHEDCRPTFRFRAVGRSGRSPRFKIAAPSVPILPFNASTTSFANSCAFSRARSRPEVVESVSSSSVFANSKISRNAARSTRPWLSVGSCSARISSSIRQKLRVATAAG